MKTDGSDQNTKGGATAVAKPLTEEERARKTMQSQITSMAKEFERALPGKIGVERMMRIVMTAILKTPKLTMCEPISFMGSLLQALQLGLEVNTPLGQAYLIPRRKNDRNGKFLYWECNFQIGYQGLLTLCYRYSDKDGKSAYRLITAEVVYEGDYFDYRYGTKQFLDHRPEGKKDAKPTHVWALYQLENGGERFAVWTWDEAIAHGKAFSDSFDEDEPWKSPWLKNDTTQEEMAKKSVLKALLKYAPKSVEIASAVYADGNAIIANKFEDGGNMQLSLDVKQIVAPDVETQEFMAHVNGAGKKTEEAETVPLNRGKAGEAPAQAATAPKESAGTSAPRNAAPAQSGGNQQQQSKSGALFPPDEAADLEGVELPDFGNRGEQ
jgi:recombination protein RecT